MSWHYWIIGSAVLFILEMIVPGFLLACFGIGGTAAGIVALLGLGLEWQILTFCIITLLVFWQVRPFIIKHFYKSSENVKTNVDALAGKTGTVVVKIDPVAHKGRVKVGGEDWWGESFDEKPIEVGQKIEVLKVEGSKLIIKPINN
jgi:membrane protein implicated in regulation of membrane protease activity